MGRGDDGGSMTWDVALRVGAKCLHISLEVARRHSLVVDGDLLLVRTGVLGERSVLVGIDGTALCFTPSVGADATVRAYRSGVRAPLELFPAFEESRPA